MHHHMAFAHDPALVVLSFLIAVFASYTALDMGERLRMTHGRAQNLWLAGSAAVLGGGVWSMHFIGMLAMHIPEPVSYDLDITLLSLAIAVGFAAAGFYIVTRGNRSAARIAAGGTVLGVGVAAMHYTGMAALHTGASVHYDWPLVALSVVIAIVAANVALTLAFALRRTWVRGAAAIVMAVAICGMHYTGMAAAMFDAASRPIDDGNPTTNLVLAAGVAAVTVALILIALVAALLDRKFEALVKRDVVIQAFLSTVDMGVVVVGRDMTISYMNDRLAEIFHDSVAADQRIGENFETVLLERHDRFNTSPQDRERSLQWLRSPVEIKARFQLPNGGTLELRQAPLPAGGFVRTYIDVSAEVAFHERLTLAKLSSDKESRTVALLRGVASAANSALDVDDAIGKCLRLVCEFTHCQVGHAYIWVQQKQHLAATDLWHLDDETRYAGFVESTRQTTMAPGEGLIGRVWETRTPIKIVDCGSDPDFLRAKAAAQAGLVSAFAFPIVVGVNAPYVLEFFCTGNVEVNADLLDIIKDIGLQLSQVILRARARAALADAQRAAESSSRAKSQFLAAMSHEIRTLMNGVIGVVELLQSEMLSAKHKKMVEIIRQSGQSLLNVINDILDFSKIEAGRMTVENTRFALGEVIESTAVSIGGHTKSKTINLICAVDPAIDWIVEGDPMRIRQVLLNLLSNALKFTETGTISIEAKAESVTGDQVTVLFEVTDTGIGIPPDKQEDLFDPFKQADYSTTRKFGGTGLGLSICKNLVQLMDGAIGCRSVPDEGSTFWFKIPFKRVPDSERTDPFKDFQGVLAGLRVLVSGRTLLCASVNRYLRAVGVDLIEARSVREGIDRLSEAYAAGRPVDVAIMKAFVGDDSAAQFVEALNKRKDVEQTKMLFVLPLFSASAGRLPVTKGRYGTLASPIQRRQLYEAIADIGSRVWRHQEALEAHDLSIYSAPKVDEAAAQGCLILVAEDNETNTFVIENQLQRLGYAAEFAVDGREAWNIYQGNKHRYGLLITDCHMPYMDGYELTGQIREHEKTTHNRLPIIALTANALEGEAEVCWAAGMDDYLSKPAKLTALNAMIEKWLPQAAKLRSLVDNTRAQSAAVETALPIIVTPTAPVDMAELADLLGNSKPEYLNKMLAVFWDTMKDTPAQLAQLIQTRDAAKLGNAAHAAKGAAASAGAGPLAKVLKDLEMNARKPDWAVIDGLSPQIDAAFENVRAFIEAGQSGNPPDAKA